MDSLSPGLQFLPEEQRLAMPVQDLRARAVRGRSRASSPGGIGLRRAVVILPAIALTVAATWQMVGVLNVGQLTALELFILVLFVALFAWIALSFFSSLAGFFSLLGRGGAGLGISLDGAAPPLRSRTALLMPVYNEAPARVMAGLQVISQSLAELAALDQFDIFILSDTTDPHAWLAEEHAFLALRGRTGNQRIFYRRRAKNIERKAGNIGEWVQRFGGGYPQFLILDADSVMTGFAIVQLVAAMERHDDVGLIQSLPVIVGGRTLFARMQQFAGRVYGPMIAHGIAWWHGAEGNYWGHNAVIRTQAFAEAAGLPVLGGRKPFGGHILSHDFVEAALLRRAGWAVHMVPALAGSYEEGPPSLVDLGIRDRRWCQGNLQHVAVLPSRGLHWVSRMHLLMGIGSYITAPIWLLFLLAGILISLQARFISPDYFPSGRSLFPTWPIVDPVRSKWLFIGTMAILLSPKLFAYVALLCDGATRRGCGGAIRAFVSLLVETLVAGLLAPITMIRQSADVVSILLGRDAGWQPQQRDDGAMAWGDVARQYWRYAAFGVLLAVAAYFVSPFLALWMSPVLVGLILAVPLVRFTGGRGAGQALRRLGLLQTPEERTPPDVLLQSGAMSASLREHPSTMLLLADPELMRAHLAMLPAPRRAGKDPFDANLLMGLAKLAESSNLTAALNDLTPRELAATLGDAEGAHRLSTLAGQAVLTTLS